MEKIATPRREIRAWMVRTGRTYRVLAQELDVTSGCIANVLSGRRGCSLDLALRWSELSGLPVRVFSDLRAPSKRAA